MAFVHLVIDDPPEQFGGMWEILGAYDNAKAAKTHEKAYRQQDEFQHQYVKIERVSITSRSRLIPVQNRTQKKKRRTA